MHTGTEVYTCKCIGKLTSTTNVPKFAAVYISNATRKHVYARRGDRGGLGRFSHFAAIALNLLEKAFLNIA